jgi:hypothetical protein
MTLHVRCYYVIIHTLLKRTEAIGTEYRRTHVPDAVAALVEALKDERQRVPAAVAILDRALGRPAAAVSLGYDGGRPWTTGTAEVGTLPTFYSYKATVARVSGPTCGALGRAGATMGGALPAPWVEEPDGPVAVLSAAEERAVTTRAANAALSISASRWTIASAFADGA